MKLEGKQSEEEDTGRDKSLASAYSIPRQSEHSLTSSTKITELVSIWMRLEGDEAE